MKLRIIAESTKITTADGLKKAAQKNLLMEVGIDAPGDFRRTIARVYLISDIPRISKAQFEQLYKMSFAENTIAKELDLIPVHLYKEYFRHSDEEGWYEWLEEVYDDQFKIEVTPWKTFAKTIRKAFPWVENSHDDFAYIKPDEVDDEDDEDD